MNATSMRKLIKGTPIEKILDELSNDEDNANKLMPPELDEALENKGIILLESDSINTPLYCKKVLLNLAQDPEITQIVLYINSSGGEFSSFMSLHDTILVVRKKYKKKVITIVNGVAASGAALTLQAGDVRLATKNSYVMIHEVSSFISDIKTSDLVLELELMKKFQKTAFKIWADKMGTTVKQLQELVGREDWYLTAREAKSNGLIDGIIC